MGRRRRPPLRKRAAADKSDMLVMGLVQLFGVLAVLQPLLSPRGLAANTERFLKAQALRDDSVTVYMLLFIVTKIAIAVQAVSIIVGVTVIMKFVEAVVMQSGAVHGGRARRHGGVGRHEGPREVLLMKAAEIVEFIGAVVKKLGAEKAVKASIVAMAARVANPRPPAVALHVMKTVVAMKFIRAVMRKSGATQITQAMEAMKAVKAAVTIETMKAMMLCGV